MFPRVWIPVLLVEYAVGFAPHVAPDTYVSAVRGVRNLRPSTRLQLQGWFGRKKGSGEEPVGFISMESGEEKSKDPTDVYASRLDTAAADNLSKDGIIDVKLAKEEKPKFKGKTDFDVVVVGAGCAGIGVALMLTRTFRLDTSRVLVVEQGKKVGESFRKWPEEMRFISPSFNQQGWTGSFDLNAIHYDTSPAFMLRSEHPSGEEYANYLEGIADQGKLQVSLETKVISIRDVGKKNDKHPGPFHVELCEKNGDNSVDTQNKSTRYIVWAAGEFQHPRGKGKPQISTTSKGYDGSAKDEKSSESSLKFPGAELCLHNSSVRSWAKLPGDDFIIIGGYESGIDAAVNLAKADKKCKVLASTPCWNLKTGDPSSELAPFTSDRLRSVLSHDFSPNPKLFAPLRVIAVDKVEGGGFGVAARWKALDEATPASTYDSSGFRAEVPRDTDRIQVFRTNQAPILCTGFEGSVAAQASHLFAFPDPKAEKKACIGDGPLLTREDESTTVKGVFLVGPSVTHGDLSFCFVYKFRQRFAVVANAICQGLGMDTDAALAECRRTDMYLDNFATCEDTCGDAC